MGRLADRVRETTTSTGTGNITLAGAVTGFETFSTNFVVSGPEFTYCIQGQGTAEWEMGSGYLSGSTTLVRSQVYSSSNSNSLVSFSAGTKDVFCTVAVKNIMTIGLTYAHINHLAGN